MRRLICETRNASHDESDLDENHVAVSGGEKLAEPVESGVGVRQTAGARRTTAVMAIAEKRWTARAIGMIPLEGVQSQREQSTDP